MKSWLLRNAKYILTVVGLILMVSGWIGTAHYSGVAKAEAAEGARLTEEIDDYRAQILEDSLEMAEADAALTIARENDVRRVGELQAARRAEQDARELFDRTAQAQRDSTDGWVRAETYDATLAAQQTETARADSIAAVNLERAERTENHVAMILRPMVTRLTAQTVRLEARDMVRVREIDARTPRPTLSFGNLTENWELVALGVLIGAVAWEVAR